MKGSKQIALLLTGALSLASLTGCSGAKDTSKDVVATTETAAETKTEAELAAKAEDLKGAITVLTHRTDMTEVFEGYKKEFEAAHPGTEINFEAVNDYQNTISSRMGTADYGDVLMMPANIMKNEFSKFYEPMGTAAELNTTYDYTDNFNYEETLYGLATGVNANGFIYNAQVFKDAGIETLPTTIDEFLNALQAIKDKTDAIPYYTNYVADWSLTNFTNALNVEITGDNDYPNKLTYNKKEFAEGGAIYTSLKILHDIVAKDLCEEDPMTSDWEYSKQAIADGKIGVMCLGSWAVGQVQALSKNPENIKFMGAPVMHDGKFIVQIAPDFGMAVNVNSENKPLAKEFVKYFVEKYPNDSNMISSIVGAPLPEYLSGVSNIELVEQVMGTPEQTKDFDAVQKEALISLYDGTWIKTVIEIGLGNGNQNFEEYMASLNTSWANAIDSLGK